MDPMGTKPPVRNSRNQVSAWAQDPEVQQRAKHYATEAARAAGQAGVENFRKWCQPDSAWK